MENKRRTRTRFAPSPTGSFHVGGARTALFTWLTARHDNGVMILRIEDTDQTRYDPKALDDIISSLRWLGIEWDEGPETGGPFAPYFQSERTALYQEHAKLLLENGAAYHCYCTPERLEQMRSEQQKKGISPGYDGHCRTLTEEQKRRYESQGIVPVVRLKVPHDGETSFNDLIRGKIKVENKTLDDIILLKSDGFPTYHLANVVDDHFMEITHVTRSSEWIPSTPKHILLYNAFGWEPPVFAHLPVILDPSGKGKMSKRKSATADKQFLVHVQEFRDAGYLPEAMINFLALLGWATPDARDFFTLDELIKEFDLTRVNPSGAAFSYEKLDWMNGMYMRSLTPEKFVAHLQRFYADQGIKADPELVRKIAPLIQERIKTLRDALDLTRFFFYGLPEYEPSLLIPKKGDMHQVSVILQKSIEALNALPELQTATAEAALRSIADSEGVNVRNVCHVVRVAIEGSTIGPPLFESLEIIGLTEVVKRLELAAQRAK